MSASGVLTGRTRTAVGRAYDGRPWTRADGVPPGLGHQTTAQAIRWAAAEAEAAVEAAASEAYANQGVDGGASWRHVEAMAAYAAAMGAPEWQPLPPDWRG